MKKKKLELEFESDYSNKFISFVKKHEKDFIVAMVVFVIGLAGIFSAKYYINYRDGKLSEQFSGIQRSYPSLADPTSDKETLKVFYKNVLEGFDNINKNSSYSLFNDISSVYLGNSYFDIADYKNSAAYYQKSIGLKQFSALTEYNTGLSYEQEKNYKGALEQYEKILSNKDSDFMKEISYLSAIRCCIILKKNDKVKALYEEFNKNYKNSKFLAIARDFAGEF